MGEYVNPTDMSKESWLAIHGTEVDLSTPFESCPPDKWPLVLVDNGPFTALAICMSAEEKADFFHEDDYRPKRLFFAPKSELKQFIR